MSLVVALLRGVNVGGHARVPMSELKSALSKLGFDGVQTYLQSGNVLLDPGKLPSRDLPAVLENVIAHDFGVEIRVIVRTGAELAAVAADHPLSKQGSHQSLLHVIFLERDPAPDNVADLDPNRSPPDRFEARGREIYLSYPGGQGRSKLSLDYFERVLGMAGTARNWNTVTRLVEMVR